MTFTFTRTGTKTTSIIIWPLYKYTTVTLEQFGDSFEESVLDFIKAHDTDKSFYYTNIPETPITNPLVAQTFLDPTHFYNKFTICEWDTTTDKNNIKIHDVMR